MSVSLDASSEPQADITQSESHSSEKMTLKGITENIIASMINEINHNGQLEVFRNEFERRRIYNQHQKNYIENEKIKLELGKDYESEESDNENDDEFGSLSKYELKCILKENLIKTGYDETKLSYIEPPTPEDIENSDRDYIETSVEPTTGNGSPNDQVSSSQPIRRDFQLNTSILCDQLNTTSQLKNGADGKKTSNANTQRDGLNVIDEQREVVSSNLSQKNLWALDYFIAKLEELTVEKC